MATKKTTATKKYIVLDFCFDSDTYDYLNEAIAEAKDCFEKGTGEEYYVAEIIRTVKKGAPVVVEGYFSSDDEKNS